MERFRAKCRFEAASGCVVWTGGTSATRNGSGRAPVFRDEKGKRVRARRWAAINIHGLEVNDGDVVMGSCGEERCVQHVTVASVPYLRMNYVLAGLGYEAEPIGPRDPAPDHGGVPFHTPPGWLHG